MLSTSALRYTHFYWWACCHELVCSVLLSPLLQARTDLENHSVDAATTSEAVVFITLLQGLKRNMRTWEQSVEVCNMHGSVCVARTYVYTLIHTYVRMYVPTCLYVNVRTYLRTHYVSTYNGYTRTKAYSSCWYCVVLFTERWFLL